MGLAPTAAFAIAGWELFHHPWRSLLVTQGMLWAVALAIVPAAIIEGSRSSAVERAAELGTDRIEITAAEDAKPSEVVQDGDYSALGAALPKGVAMAALEARPALLAADDTPLWLLETRGELPRVRNLSLLAGAWFCAGEDSGTVPVVVEFRLASKFSPSGSVLGLELELEPAARGERARVRILATPPTDGTVSAASAPGARAAETSQRLRIVGVLADESAQSTNAFGIKKEHLFTEQIHDFIQGMGINMQRPPWLTSGNGIFLPANYFTQSELHSIFLRCDPLQVEAVAARAEELLVARGRRPLLATNAIWSVLSRPELEGYLLLHRLFFWLYVAIGLLVMTNLLLLSGWRRRREIALRRAEGATRGDILRQFLWEGVLLAALGIVLGVLTGLSLAAIRVRLDPSAALTFAFPWRAAIDAAAILLAGALVAAAYPAWRASRHEPMLLFRGGRAA